MLIATFGIRNAIPLCAILLERRFPVPNMALQFLFPRNRVLKNKVIGLFKRLSYFSPRTELVDAHAYLIYDVDAIDRRFITKQFFSLL